VNEQSAASSVVYYFDSSALVKRYAIEIGTDWIKALCAEERNAQAIASIGLVEIVAALAGKQRGGFLTLDECDQLLAELVQDVQVGYLLIAVDRVVIDQAIALTRRHKLRGYDAVHLACALTLQQILAAGEGSPLTFIAADDDLLAAAAAEGFSTDNPNDHP
jgi:predicted nucleic acid-binding protein